MYAIYSLNPNFKYVHKSQVNPLTANVGNTSYICEEVLLQQHPIFLEGFWDQKPTSR